MRARADEAQADTHRSPDSDSSVNCALSSRGCVGADCVCSFHRAALACNEARVFTSCTMLQCVAARVNAQTARTLLQRTCVSGHRGHVTRVALRGDHGRRARPWSSSRTHTRIG